MKAQDLVTLTTRKKLLSNAEENYFELRFSYPAKLQTKYDDR